MGGSRGLSGARTPLFCPRCRLFNIGLKGGPLLEPPFFSCRPNMDLPPPLSKILDPPLSCHIPINSNVSGLHAVVAGLPPWRVRHTWAGCIGPTSVPQPGRAALSARTAARQPPAAPPPASSRTPLSQSASTSSPTATCAPCGRPV